MELITIRSPLDYQRAVRNLMKLRSENTGSQNPGVKALAEAIEHYESVTAAFGNGKPRLVAKERRTESIGS